MKFTIQMIMEGDFPTGKDTDTFIVTEKVWNKIGHMLKQEEKELNNDSKKDCINIPTLISKESHNFLQKENKRSPKKDCPVCGEANTCPINNKQKQCLRCGSIFNSLF